MLHLRSDDLNAIRWNDGERLEHLFEERCDQFEREGRGDHPAVVADGKTHSFRELDEQANRLARHLIAQGVRAGDRVGLLVDKSFDMYVALLGVLKANAAYVPLDAGFPADRINFILQDAGAKVVLSTSGHEALLADIAAPRIFLDKADADIRAQPGHRLTAEEKGGTESQLAYIIYTSGTTGTPKGVVIEHPSICNFVKVAAEIYGYTADDRVYQGLTIAFDFSVEEILVPLVVGATLVPGKPDGNLVGQELHAYLAQNNITAFCCVPTLLATIEEDLPELRLLLVSGEACPQDLVARWHRPGRTILNAYGPTEATVTATITQVSPDKPVTIGKALPSYTIVLLDEQEDKLAPEGESGEIGIAGIGLAKGYLNRDDLTRQKFIPDFLNIPNNPSKRIYRTGDLGRFTESGEIEYQGRIDTQVKIRGYRIELTEIETLILRLPQVTQAVVSTYEPEPGAKELVAYYSLKAGAPDLDRNAVVESMRGKLPPYMVPAYFERLDIIPMTTSHKADRKKLPAPKGPRQLGSVGEHVAPRTRREKEIAAAMEEALRVEKVSVRSNFFSELGAHSILMAQFCTALRRRLPDSDVSIRDVYKNPTVEALAAHLEKTAVVPVAPVERAPRHNPSDLAYYGCGVAQLATYTCLGLFTLWLLLVGFHWTYAAIDHTGELYARIAAFLAGSFFGLTTLSIAAKWILVGTWKPETIPLWSLRYFQFWLAKLFIASAPVTFFIGTPLYNVYLRLLGARIGKHVVIRSSAPVCTDLFSVGDGTLIRDGSFIPGYHAKGNFIHIGGTRIGKSVFVGAASVLDIDTRIGDGGQLGNSSTLQQGQRVPPGKRYHGTPAEPTEVDYLRVGSLPCSTLRRWVYTVAVYLTVFAPAPLPIMLAYHLFPHFHRFAEADTLDYSSPLGVIATLAPTGALISVTVFTLYGLLSLIGIRFIPLLIKPFLRVDRTYVLFGVHHFLHSLMVFVSNSGWMNALFGDSSYIVSYLKFVGFNFKRVVQTGANFGLDQIHDNPFLCSIGTSSMLSDGLAFANLEVSNTSFRLGRIDVGARNYLGNNVFFPTGAKVGNNVLIGTKTMVPIDGPVRENTGLLGSPCFEIPRSVTRDTALIGKISEEDRRALLKRKNRYNIATMLGYLLRDWILFFAGSLFLFVAILYYPIYGAASLVAYAIALPVSALSLWILAEKITLRFGRLQARTVSMYDPYFLFHERHWKLCVHPLTMLFNGTPMKNFFTRALGVKVGRKVFDDGANLYDKTLIEIGDQANLNVASVVQCHTLEDGVFKSERVVIGAGSTIGCAAYVLYGANIGKNAVLEPNACLLKGETIPRDEVWHGNPARSARRQESCGVGLRAA
jgi:non-ribosomal peptide synthetase-like protein